MSISIDLIAGFMVGIETFSDEILGTGMILDLGIVRIIVEKPV